MNEVVLKGYDLTRDDVVNYLSSWLMVPESEVEEKVDLDWLAEQIQILDEEYYELGASDGDKESLIIEAFEKAYRLDDDEEHIVEI